MKYFTHYPLRLTIPLFLVFSLCALGLYTQALGKKQSDSSVEEFGLMTVSQDMARLQGRINLHRSDYDNDGIKISIASRGADPDVKVVLLADDNDVVLYATSLKMLGRALHQIDPAAEKYAGQAKKTRSGVILQADDRQSISAYYPVDLMTSAENLRPSRVGLLVMHYDLRRLKSMGHYQVEQQLWRSLLVYAVTLLTLGGFLHYALTQRMRRLIATTKKFANGDTSARANLPGRDEIASIGGAVDNMLQTIDGDRRQLAESERRYRLLTEHIKDVVWVLDAETLTFRYVSPSVERLRGYTPAEIMAQPLIGALAAAAAREATELIRARTADFLSGRMPADHFYTNVIEQSRKDGTSVWTEVITSFYIDPESNRVEIHGVTRDISERKLWEEELRHRLDELERWQDVMLDREDRVQELKNEVNALCRTLGQPMRYSDLQIAPGEAEREAPPS